MVYILICEERNNTLLEAQTIRAYKLQTFSSQKYKIDQCYQ